jgi:hypothetical protein
MSLSDGIAWEKEFGYKVMSNNQPVVGKVEFYPYQQPLNITPKLELKPFKCPICAGKGKLPPGFYSWNNTTSSSCCEETCKPCKGTGIIWG